MEPRQPRRIRDIAHLYLSGVEKRSPKRREIIAVAAASAREFPAFHVANLAVACARKEWAVHVVECSGLVINAARFLSLPPCVYLDGPEGPGERVYSCLQRVTMGFSPSARAAVGAGGSSSKCIEIVHLPPLDRVPSHEKALDAWCDEDIAALIMIEGRTAPHGGRHAAWPARVGRFRVERFRETGVVHPGTPSGKRPQSVDSNARGDEHESVEVWGCVERWKKLLYDPVPLALRSEESTAARAYANLAHTVLNREGRTHDKPERVRQRARRRVRSFPARGAG